MTSVRYWLHATETTDFCKATEIAKKEASYGLKPEFVCSRGLFGDYWLCRISMIFDESNNTNARRVEEIGNDTVELAGEIALRSNQELDDVFSIDVVQL
jgi:hypothetical protein